MYIKSGSIILKINQELYTMISGRLVKYNWDISQDKPPWSQWQNNSKKTILSYKQYHAQWLIMTMIAHMMRMSCTHRTNRLIRGFARSRSWRILKGLFWFPRLKRAAVSGLDWCRLSLGICCRILMWSVGMPSRVRKDLIPSSSEIVTNQSLFFIP